MLYLGLKLSSEPKKVKLNDVDLDTKVENLRILASQATSVSVSEIELVFAGKPMNDGLSLKDVGLRDGVTVHVLKKIQSASPSKATPIASKEVPHIVSAFKNATRAANYRTALQRLSRPSVLKNIMAATPGLREDPVALAIIQDAELITQLCDAATVRRVLGAHPVLAEAAQYIVTAIHEASATAPGGSASSSNPTSGYYYSLEALSDDEDMEASDSPSRPFDHARFAAALAAANATTRPNNPSTPNITSEMLGRALEQALANSPAVGGPSPNVAPANVVPSTASSEMRDLESTSRRLAEHLAQMHELGLRDDTLNLQALQATDWNVQEATNLLFSGAMEDLNDPETE